MKKLQSTPIFFGLLIAAFALQSCANIDIVKRKHRPGFHVDVKGKKQRQQVANDDPQNAEIALEPVAVKPTTPIESTAEESMPSTQLAFISNNSDEQNPVPRESKFSQLLRTTYPSVKREKLNGELRRAVFNKKEEDEKYGWSTVSIISTGLGLFALGFFITGIVLLISFIFTAGFAFWWIFALLGLVFGIAAMVTGIIGMRQTGRGEKRGRGFAIAGMVAGIVSLAGALIAAFWGLIYSIINGSGDDF
jgi:preprotein translocase subunit SecF